MLRLKFLPVIALILTAPVLSGAEGLVSAEQGEVSCKSTSQDPYCVYPPPSVKLKVKRQKRSLASNVQASHSKTSRANVHRAAFENSDKDYLHMDAVLAQLGEVVLPVAKPQQNPLTRSRRHDYLQMEWVEAQLDPAIKSEASSLVSKPSEPNVFSRLVIPDREFLSPDENSAGEAPYTEKNESPINNYCVVKRGASTSRIARDVCSGPLYDEAGCLPKLLTLNPAVKDPNLIFAGQRLVIPSGDHKSSGCEGGEMAPLRLPASAAKPAPKSKLISPVPTPVSDRLLKRQGISIGTYNNSKWSVRDSIDVVVFEPISRWNIKSSELKQPIQKHSDVHKWAVCNKRAPSQKYLFPRISNLA